LSNGANFDLFGVLKIAKKCHFLIKKSSFGAGRRCQNRGGILPKFIQTIDLSIFIKFSVFQNQGMQIRILKISKKIFWNFASP